MLGEGPAQHFLPVGDDLVKVADLRVKPLRVDEGARLARDVGRPFGGERDLLEVAADRLEASGRIGS